MKIPLIKSGFYKEQETRRLLADFTMTTEKFSMGQMCAAFETAFCATQRRKHAVYVTSGSAANLITLQSLLNLGRIKLGDKIGFSALTWPTNVMPIIQLGLVPVALDCELSTLNVSSRILRKAGDMRALFITNVLGFCDDLDVIRQYCQDTDIILLEDNCESLGSSLNNELLGNFGLASTFSFFVGHHLSTIEGGMICTDDDALHEMLLMTRVHGWDRNLSPDAQDRLRSIHKVDAFYARYAFYDLAYNTRPTELQGFLGMNQLPYLEEMILQRVANFQRFHAAVAARPERFIPLHVSHMSRISNFAMPVVCKNEKICLEIRQRFTSAEVEIRPIIAGDMTKQPFYVKYCQPASCLNADIAHRQGFYFGNNPEMTEKELLTLCSLLTDNG